MTQLEQLVDAGNYLGECPLWCERGARVFWTDIEGRRLHSYAPDSGVARDWPMPERLACFALTGDADVLLLGLASRLAFFNLRSGAVTPVHAVETALPMTRINDGRCDRQGRFVFGTLDERPCRDAIGGFYRLNHNLGLERLPLPPVAIANSICFSPDGAAMYFCDSMKPLIYRWDDYAGGDAARVSVFADVGAELGGKPGAPDGASVDADGYLWSAQWGAARVVRYTPGGAVDRVLPLPVTQPSCVCLGGDDYAELFVTTAQESLTPAQLADQPQAGALFHAFLSGVRGLPETRFGAPQP
ncbi:L-arabinonolactonase [Janthinobacterium sp. CG_23.3]|uniref:SMP-30/gluconolactonase/LRE family protein n=1 Tax=Janthinobacterium sp. CG_23.3 TaxID=3349634 RepID=UPI0038D4C9B3